MNKKSKGIKFHPQKVGFCRFKKLGNKYLVTNDIGRYVFLSPDLFKQFMKSTLKENSETYRELEQNEFIKDSLDKKILVEKYRQRNSFVFLGPSLHIVVVTLRCNFKCIYCQASSRDLKEKGYDMDIATAQKVVDTIFCTPNNLITIEFQGGEPLVNWPVVKFIVEYARKKSEAEGKNLFITLVSNFSLLTEERYKFLTKNRVIFCTSLDGPEELHNKNRPWPGHDSYKTTVSWIKKIQEHQKKDSDLYHLSALLTVSKFSLKYPKEIIDTYLKLGLSGIHLRPLSFLGLSGKMRSRIGYSTEEFMKFWREAMDYIIGLNLIGKIFQERGSRIMLKKILTDQDPNFLDLRSPCGAGIGQMLYNYDGKVYTCDEGRMIGDDTFVIGDVKKNTYRETISHDTVKSMCVASLLDNLPCDNCVYKPYCGVCPVLNYALYGDVFASLSHNEQCKLHQGMLDYLFEKLQDDKTKNIFENWVKPKLDDKL